MDGPPTFLALLWFGLLGLILFIYVALDGFDLGVGILSPSARDEESRGVMMASLGNMWHPNQTWLVVLGGLLFGAFPVAYGVVLSAFYLPMLLMLLGFIFRGVSFEFQAVARGRSSGAWPSAAGAGSPSWPRASSWGACSAAPGSQPASLPGASGTGSTLAPPWCLPA